MKATYVKCPALYLAHRRPLINQLPFLPSCWVALPSPWLPYTQVSQAACSKYSSYMPHSLKYSFLEKTSNLHIRCKEHVEKKLTLNNILVQSSTGSLAGFILIIRIQAFSAYPLTYYACSQAKWLSYTYLVSPSLK